MLSPRLSHRRLAQVSTLALASLCSCNLLAETETKVCNPQVELAPAGFDFTAPLDRWGQKSMTILASGEDERRVGKLYINRLPIFDLSDPGENRFIYRWANRVHTTTRKPVIDRLLLFREGETVNERKLRESERLLRSRAYISNATIRVVNDCNDAIDLEVITKEVWSLIPEISFKTAGGENSSSMGLSDSNFLGTGKRVSVSYKKDPQRDTMVLHYNDDSLAGSRKTLRAHWGESSDGYERLLQVGLPFYELNAQHSWRVSARENLMDLTEYALGKKIAAIAGSSRNFESALGFSRGLIDGMTRRFTLGLTVDRTGYSPSRTEPLPASGLPADLNLVYPWIEYERIENKYKVVYNIQEMNRVEDLYVGRYLRSRLGYSTLDDRRLVFQGQLSDTLISADGILLQGSLGWLGRWNLGESQSEDARLDVGLRYYRGQSSRRTLFIGLKAAVGQNLQPGNRLTMDEESDLRGFPTYYQSGDASLFISVEQRFYTNLHPLHLASVGFAAFLDIGEAWFRDQGMGSQELLADVGFGIRLIPDKSDKGQVIHIDIAHPLNRDLPNVGSLQFSARVKKAF